MVRHCPRNAVSHSLRPMGGAVIAQDSDVEVVKVDYPPFLPNGRKARFWRLVIGAP